MRSYSEVKVKMVEYGSNETMTLARFEVRDAAGPSLPREEGASRIGPIGCVCVCALSKADKAFSCRVNNRATRRLW